MDGFCINEKILHSWRRTVKQHAIFGRSLAIFTKHADMDDTRLLAPQAALKHACLVNCAKLKGQLEVSFDRQ